MPRNETEQQRIAAALETIAGSNEGTKKNVTEQQRIASALEAMAEGGGGGSSGVMIITEDFDDSKETDILPVMAQDIFDALENKLCVVKKIEDNSIYYSIISAVEHDGDFFAFVADNGNATYIANSPVDYPSKQ